MTTRDASTAREPANLLTRRSFAWLWLAIACNGVVLLPPTVLALSSIGPDWEWFLAAAGPFIAPAYSPALLFFTVILTLLERAPQPHATHQDDQLQANHLIANSIRLALVVVLSFAVLMVMIQPTALAPVLFAVLVSFVAIVRAELMAPPRRLDAETTYRRALAAQIRAEERASRALGDEWRERPAKRTWTTIFLFCAAPIIVPGGAVMVIASLLWGADNALTPNFIVMSLVLMLGPSMLVLAWLSAAEKSESLRSRGWRLAFMVVMSTMGTLVLASIFLLSGPDWWWVGAIVLATAAIVAACLWGPAPSWIRRRRRVLERTWTTRRLKQLAKTTKANELAWHADRDSVPVVVRMLARVFRVVRRAYGLARED
jgi:hypothetical protein